MIRRVLITGGSGFIGTNLVSRLLSENSVTGIINFDLVPPRDRTHGEFWCPGDIRDPDQVRAALANGEVTHVVHLAARTDLDGAALADYDSNTRGTAAVVEAIQGYGGVQRAVFASSRLVCRIGYVPAKEDDYCPVNAYGESKVVSERIIRGAGGLRSWIIVRPTSVWGPFFDTPYRDFFVSVRKGRYFNPKDQEVWKSFGYAGNTAWQLWRLLVAADFTLERRTTYLCDYEPIELKAFAREIADSMGVRRPRELPLVALRAAARAGDLAKRTGLSRQPPLTSFRLTNLMTEMLYPIDALQALTGPLPYTRSEGVRATVDYLRNTDDE